MTSRERRVHLTIAQKYEVILLMERGESRKNVMHEFNIGESTLYKIYAQREKVKNQFEIGTLPFTHSIRRPRQRMVDVDRVVLHWYLRCKERNIEVEGPGMRRKAVEINEELNGHPGFRASTTWLLRFKRRYHITIGEDWPLAIEYNQSESFTDNFSEFLESNGYILKNVYNVVYSQMIWKAGPPGTPISSNTELTESLQTPDDFVTILFCANATGYHKLPVLLIGNVPESECFCNIDLNISVTIYRYKTYPSMDNTMFKIWFEEIFIHAVLNRQRWDTESRAKFLLILNNASSLLDLTELNNINPFITVKSPPLHVSALIQPMNCGIITCFKRKYRVELLKATAPLPMYNVDDEMTNRHRALSMWDCCRIVDSAWINVHDDILIKSWDTLLMPTIMRSVENTNSFHTDICKALELLHTIPGCDHCQQIDVINWTHMDTAPALIMTVCTEEVLREFRNNTLRRVITDITDDQAGPSYS